MAKRKRNDGAIPATDAASAEATLVSTEALPVAEATPAEQPPQAVPVLRLFVVSLPSVRELTLEAESPEQAWERYKAAMGITATVHNPKIQEVG